MRKKMLSLLIVTAVVVNTCSTVVASANEIRAKEGIESIEESNLSEDILLEDEKNNLENKEVKEEAVKNKNLEENIDEKSENKELNSQSNLNLYDSFEGSTKIERSYRNFKTQNYNIVSESIITKEEAKAWARKRNASEEFIGLADLYWKYYKNHGNVNPAIAYAQAAKETGYGNFGGVLDATYKNPCGLKKTAGGGDTDPEAHQRFESWDIGVQAHLDHLALYAGATGYPRKDTNDPRHFPSIAGVAPTVEDLNTRWAPSPTYGTAIVGMYNIMISEAYSDVNKFQWKQIDGIWYYMNGKGEKTKDWINLDGYWYYLDNNGKMLTGWQLIKGSWYFLKSNGVMATGIFNDGYDDYFLDSTIGNMKTGWQLLNGKYYSMQDNGVMRKGWYNDGYDWYYLDRNSGIMQTGWNDIDGSTYYLKDNGVMLTGWQVIDGNWYYFYSSGAMARNTYIGSYYVNSEGVWRTKKLIVVDPGHSATGDLGSSATFNGKKYVEGELNMQVSLKVKEELEKKGYEVRLTREASNKNNISLAARTEFANNLKADAFVSIHHDSAGSTAKGVTSFYSSYKPLIEDDYVLAPGWGGEIRMDPTPSEEAKIGKRKSDSAVVKIANASGFNNRNSHDRNLYVTKNTIMPAALIECGFLSNAEEAVKISNPEVQRKTAQSIANAVKEVIN